MQVCAPRPAPDAVPACTSCCVYFLSTSCESGVHPCSVRLYSFPFCGTHPRFPQPVSCFLGQPTPIRLQNPLRAAPPQAAAHHVAADTQGARAVLVKNRDGGARGLIQSLLCHELTGNLGQVASLSLSFLICEVGIIARASRFSETYVY